jgi:hypothetical protein
MTEPQEGIQAQAAQGELPPRTRSPNHQTLYVNVTEFGMTPWDLHIMIGNVHVGQFQSIGIEETAEIIMSPQHAKAFMLALTANVNAWEEAYGAIKLPASIITRTTGQTKAEEISKEDESAEQQTVASSRPDRSRKKAK